jgi:predicted permease
MWRWHRRTAEDFSQEIQAAIALETDRLIATGVSPAEARSAALRAFGNVTRAQERFRESGRVRWLDNRRIDLGYASRTLRKNPGFTTVVVLTLALGIGATTAIFAIVDAVFLKPLPYQHSERLLALGSNAFGFGGGNTAQTFLFLKDRLASFSRIAASRDGNGWNLVVNQRAEYVRALLVTSGYFEVFGTQPLYGREFSEAEGQVNGPLAIVLSEALWRRVFEARPEAIGTIVRLGGSAYTVVGVMPASFHSIPTVDVWTPLRLAPGDNALNYSISGRLRDDRSIGQAAHELDALKPTMLAELATTNGSFPDRINRLGWVPYRATVTGRSRPVIQVLLGGALLVLLAACANVAALQLIRTTVLRRELAIRAALGGGPSRSAWHLLTESSILGLFGAAVGMAIATGVLSYVHPLLSESFLAGQTPSIDLRVLAAAAGLGLLTSVVFGGWPAVDAARLNLSDALSSGSRTVTSGKRTSRIRRLLVAGQVGIAATLLVTAGLFARARPPSQQCGYRIRAERRSDRTDFSPGRRGRNRHRTASVLRAHSAALTRSAGRRSGGRWQQRPDWPNVQPGAGAGRQHHRPARDGLGVRLARLLHSVRYRCAGWPRVRGQRRHHGNGRRDHQRGVCARVLRLASRSGRPADSAPESHWR